MQAPVLHPAVHQSKSPSTQKETSQETEKAKGIICLGAWTTIDFAMQYLHASEHIYQDK